MCQNLDVSMCFKSTSGYDLRRSTEREDGRQLYIHALSATRRCRTRASVCDLKVGQVIVCACVSQSCASLTCSHMRFVFLHVVARVICRCMSATSQYRLTVLQRFVLRKFVSGIMDYRHTTRCTHPVALLHPLNLYKQ